MDLLSIILIAIGLAMDCFAVSIAQGLSVAQKTERPKPVMMAFLFGLFQGGMPLIGYWAGTLFADFFKLYAPWIALALLAFTMTSACFGQTCAPPSVLPFHPHCSISHAAGILTP